MTSKILKTTLVSFTALAILFPLSASTILAAPNPTVVAARQTERITELKARGDKEIETRITSLNKAISSIQAANKLTEAQKTALINSDQTVISNLNALKAKIDSDTDLATLRTDVKSVFTQYRVYMLVMPQNNILRASDRIQDVVTNLNALVTKLQSRIDQAKTAGKDVTSMQNNLTDLQTKTADAQKQAQNATDLVSGLVADAGDKTRATANQQALISARADIKLAIQDIQAAWTDAKSIVSNVKALK